MISGDFLGREVEHGGVLAVVVGAGEVLDEGGEAEDGGFERGVEPGEIVGSFNQGIEGTDSKLGDHDVAQNRAKGAERRLEFLELRSALEIGVTLEGKTNKGELSCVSSHMDNIFLFIFLKIKISKTL